MTTFECCVWVLSDNDKEGELSQISMGTNKKVI
jgi:hypothetical protein